MKKVVLISLIALAVSCKKEKDDPIVSPAPAPITSVAGAGVTDVDGNTYSTIVLGNGQEWMVENLRTTKYCNGDSIPNITNDADWQNLTSGAWAHYNNDNQYEIPYGKLYNGYSGEDVRNICPCDWHLPTTEEWVELSDYLGGQAVSGGKMKSTGNIDDANGLWNSPNTEASNLISFSGHPGGLRDQNGTFGGFGDFGCWVVGIVGSNISLDFDSPAMDWWGNVGADNRGVSVRCLKD